MRVEKSTYGGGVILFSETPGGSTYVNTDLSFFIKSLHIKFIKNTILLLHTADILSYVYLFKAIIL